MSHPKFVGKKNMILLRNQRHETAECAHGVYLRTILEHEACNGVTHHSAKTDDGNGEGLHINEVEVERKKRVKLLNVGAFNLIVVNMANDGEIGHIYVESKYGCLYMEN